MDDKQSQAFRVGATEAAIQEKPGKLEEGMAARSQTPSWAFGRKWLQALLLSPALLMGTTLGGWGVVTLLAHRGMALRTRFRML